jgi:hypothetical protein
MSNGGWDPSDPGWGLVAIVWTIAIGLTTLLAVGQC